jgi:azurin
MKKLAALLASAVLSVGLVSASALLGGCGSTAEQNLGTVGNTMVYDVTSFSVKAGQKVHLVLKNNGDTPAMTHNWVLVKPGTETAVATDGTTAGPALNYVKAGDPNVLASTAIANPGATVEVTFTAPSEPGAYPYICTFPAHFQTMKGTLTVTPK